MSSSTLLARDGLLPRPPGGLAPGALLALLVHGGLVAAIALSVQWRSATVDAVSAELWAAVPQTAAPRAVEAPTPSPAPSPTPSPTQPPAQPPPEPPAPAPLPAPAPKAGPAGAADAQIAVERARRVQQERERLLEERRQRDKAERDKLAEKLARDAAADKLQQAEAAKKRQAEERAEQLRKQAEKQVEERRMADLREANLKRMLGQAGASGSPTATGTALRDAAPSATYVGRLVAAIKPNIVFADSLPGNPAAEVEVSATATGSIIARRLRKSSGHKEWDDAVLRAIDRTGTLPRDTDGRVPTSFVISFRPRE